MRPAFWLPNRGTILWILAIYLLHYLYGAFTLYCAAFQQTSSHEAGQDTSPNTTLLLPYREASVCPVPFSVALTNGIEISFFSGPYLNALILGVRYRVLPRL
jgi:hypothetical protein